MASVQSVAPTPPPAGSALPAIEIEAGLFVLRLRGASFETIARGRHRWKAADLSARYARQVMGHLEADVFPRIHAKLRLEQRTSN